MIRLAFKYLPSEKGKIMLFAARNFALILTLILLAVPSSLADTWALLVGISDYQDLNIRDPRYAANDAKQLYKTLIDRRVCAAPQEKAYLMTDESDTTNLPTSANVLSRLRDLVAQIELEDTFIFYFSGYATVRDGKQFLLSMDSDASSTSTLNKSAITIEAIQSEFREVKARQVVIILNVFYNNPGNRAPQTRGRLDRESVLTDELVRGFKELRPRVQIDDLSRTATFFSSSVGERAYDWDEEKCSVFSFYLLEGLRGKAADSENQVTLSGLAEYVREQVVTWSRERGTRQTPWLDSSGTARVVLAEPLQFGILEVEAVAKNQPIEAEVFLDDREIGLTPLIEEGVRPGTHKVRVRAPLYHEYSRAVKIKEGDEFSLEAELRPAFGSLKVESTPPGAEVDLSGEQGASGITPFSLDKLLSGDYKLSVSKSRYHTESRDISIQDAQVGVVSFELRPTFGILEITSEPQGALVSLEREGGQEKEKGRTPVKWEPDPGNYILRLQYDFYSHRPRQVEIQEGSEIVIRETLTPNFGTLNVQVTPDDSRIDVDGEDMGRTPAEGLRLNPGEHHVKVINDEDDLVPLERTIFITRGQAESLSGALVRNIGTLSVTSKPTEARITVDEKDYGVTPKSFDLPPGKYKLKLLKESFVDFDGHEEVVTIEYGKTVNCDIVMKRSRSKLALLSLLMPGWGQYFGNRRVSGTAFLFTGSGAVAVAAISYYQYNGSVNSYNEAVARYRRAFADDEVKNTAKEMDEAYNKAERKFKSRRTAFGVLAGVWAANVLHVLILGPSITPASPYAQPETLGLHIVPQATPGTMGVLAWHRF
jgi:uncharacterized caspase-like protein